MQIFNWFINQPKNKFGLLALYVEWCYLSLGLGIVLIFGNLSFEFLKYNDFDLLISLVLLKTAVLII